MPKRPPIVVQAKDANDSTSPPHSIGINPPRVEPMIIPIMVRDLRFI